MSNSIKGINSKEVKTQLKRVDVQKNVLIENLYKEYEIYFQIVRKNILNSVEKGIFGLYTDLSINDKLLNSKELIKFLNKNISFLINSKLPLITIEQFKLGNATDPHIKLYNANALKDLADSKECQEFNFNYDLISNHTNSKKIINEKRRAYYNYFYEKLDKTFGLSCLLSSSIKLISSDSAKALTPTLLIKSELGYNPFSQNNIFKLFK